MRLLPRGEILMTGYGADLQDIVQALLSDRAARIRRA